ncbi:DUF6249 domain-containing protein [Mucilaginibacter sp.]
MEQNLAVALMFITIVISITILIIAILNYRVKNRLLRSGLADESAVKALNKLQFDFKIDSLKWGLILLSGGLGLIMLNFIPFKTDSTLPYGIEIVFISAGLLAYFLISGKTNPSA